MSGRNVFGGDPKTLCVMLKTDFGGVINCRAHPIRQWGSDRALFDLPHLHAQKTKGKKGNGEG